MCKKRNIEIISVIVPVYNVRPYLRQCLDSLLAQTYKDFEMILVDDGSTDDGGIICDEYAKLDSRIVVVHKKNGGLISAWKTGLTKANGDLIMFVDSDDWVDSTIIERLYDDYRKNNADIVCCSYYHEFVNKSVPDSHSVLAGVYQKEDIREKIYPVLINDGNSLSRGIRISRWGKLIRKKILVENLHWVNEKITIGEDLNIMFPVIMEADCISILDSEYLYHYRANEESMMKKVSNKMFEKATLLYEKEKEIANYYIKVYDFSEQVESDFCDLSMSIFFKEYRQNHSFENYCVARNSAYYLILKKGIRPERYSGWKKLLAIAIQGGMFLSTTIIKTMQIYAICHLDKHTDSKSTECQ